MSNEITSRLWKAALLSRDSGFFPRLVEAAAWHADKTYTDHMLRRIAATPALVDAIPLPEGEGMDAVLTRLAVTNGEDMDALIVAAVDAYVPPPE